MAESAYELLRNHEEIEEQSEDVVANRIASLDVFRGLCVFLMMLVDYGGSIFQILAHSPWNGIHLADFVMPFFLFAAGISLALYKKVPDRLDATQKASLRAVIVFPRCSSSRGYLLDILLQLCVRYGSHVKGGGK